MARYLIMDGRARFDPDRAVIIDSCDSLIEAEAAIDGEYEGYDYVVVEPGEDWAVVYDPLNK